jgi:hypothetical protein
LFDLVWFIQARIRKKYSDDLKQSATDPAAARSFGFG